MTQVLLDTNIVIDFALKREPFYSGASIVFSSVLDGKCEAYLTANSVTDVFYILKKENGHTQTIDFLKVILNFIDILGVDKNLIIKALYSNWRDFEDALQAQTAIGNGIDIIVTRNTKDFQKLQNIKVLTPDEFVEII
jgi:predicted nucleic acid-binding protein